MGGEKMGLCASADQRSGTEEAKTTEEQKSFELPDAILGTWGDNEHWFTLDTEIIKCTGSIHMAHIDDRLSCNNVNVVGPAADGALTITWDLVFSPKEGDPLSYRWKMEANIGQDKATPPQSVKATAMSYWMDQLRTST